LAKHPYRVVLAHLTVSESDFLFMNQEAEVFSNESNFAVVRMHGRAYPGVVIQGDSLAGIIGELEEAVKHFHDDPDESMGCLENALEELKWRHTAYLDVCSANNVK